MERRTIFEGWFLPVVLVLPQLLLTAFFFLWPAGEAIWWSTTRQDPFGLGSVFVGLDNFADLFADPLYVDAIVRTVIFCAAVSALSMSVALLLAVFADREIRGRAIYRTLLDEIERDGYQVLDRRIALTPLRKLWIAWRTARAA